MSAFGDLANSIASLFDEAPDVPAAPQVNAQEQQKKSIQGNLDNFDLAALLADKTNEFNYDQLDEMLRKAIPGYENIKNLQSEALQSQLKGEIPQDVQDAIQRNAATRSTYGGFGGSALAKNLTARDLGLTSLEITNRALESASRWMQGTKMLSVPNQFNAASLFISPAQQIENEWNNQTSKFQRDWTSNVIETQESNRMNHAWANVGAGVADLALDFYTGGASSMMNKGNGDIASEASGGGGFDWSNAMKAFM